VRIPGESADAHHGVIWTPNAPLEALLDAKDASSTFAVLSRRLWDPLLAIEQVDAL
jgi:exodeoxyribonuclease V gamma subunit